MTKAMSQWSRKLWKWGDNTVGEQRLTKAQISLTAVHWQNIEPQPLSGFAGMSLCSVSLGYHASQEGRIRHRERHWCFLKCWRLPVWWHQHQRSRASISLLFTPSGYYRKIYNNSCKVSSSLQSVIGAAHNYSYSFSLSVVVNSTENRHKLFSKFFLLCGEISVLFWPIFRWTGIMQTYNLEFYPGFG